MAVRFFVSLVALACSAQGATYTLERATAESMAHVPGLHVGSSMAFKANCINVDIQGIADSAGTKSTPGQLMALVADRTAGRLGPDEPEKLYFLEVALIFKKRKRKKNHRPIFSQRTKFDLSQLYVHAPARRNPAVPIPIGPLRLDYL